MDNIAIKIVTEMVSAKTDKPFKAFTVWKAKILQNWKYLVSTDLADGMYYELTYNGDKHEWYVDSYMKTDNKVVRV